VLSGDAAYPCDDLDVSGYLLIDELKLIAGAPDVRTGCVDREHAAGVRRASAERRRPDISVDPWHGQRLRADTSTGREQQKNLNDTDDDSWFLH